MKEFKIILACLTTIAIVLATYIVSKNVVVKRDQYYMPENPVISKDSPEVAQTAAVGNKRIDHSLPGEGVRTLPIHAVQSFTIYKNKLYVTNNNGKTWMRVPDDQTKGYARISEYLASLTKRNVYSSSHKISIVYGGKGSENISIISARKKGLIWTVSSIPNTATHDLQQGYDQLFIDFPDQGRIGYIASVLKEKVKAYLSLDGGETWKAVHAGDSHYDKILSLFGLQGSGAR